MNFSNYFFQYFLLGYLLAGWDVIPRDNSTIVDALNTLGCIKARNITVPIDVYVDGTNRLILQSNETLSIDDTTVKIIARCYWIFEFNIGYSLQKIIHDDDNATYLGSLEHVLENKDSFPNVRRKSVYTTPADDDDDVDNTYNYNTNSNSVINIKQTLTKGSKYVDYYNMIMSTGEKLW